MKILCVGDSLTQGWYKGGFAQAPYSEYVEQNMNKVDVVTLGYPGANTTRVLMNMMEVLGGDVSDYDAAVVLSGTNDISQCEDDPSSTANKVLTRLQKIYSTFLDKNKKLVVVTVPPFADHDPEYILTKCRNIVNDGIRSFASENNLLLAEFHDAILSEDSNTFYDDNVHMSPVGYELLGKLVVEQLKKL
eukprot:TRINITY_DN34115_c0_g1_i1.p1 TRINITY_DN34115_c0_g1~~TRINITY_DN34115_c0_g1_i1.p1  ORF type:complete len:206 (+),score=45.79 TRINITY_DN34115_c0_g1_i1:50-619(+)